MNYRKIVLGICALNMIIIAIILFAPWIQFVNIMLLQLW